MSPDDPIREDAAPHDPLLETALALTDAVPIDWERARRESPDDARALRSLEALAGIAAAHGSEGNSPEDESSPGEPVQFRWGRLEARRRLGDGSSGEVWAAWDPGLQREVALKLRRDGGSARRWLQEARRLARVRHPNVVTVHGADEHDGRPGLWMDRLHGRTLEDLLQVVGPFSAREAATIGVDLCAALAAVHAGGLVHGDIKTRNVMREGAPGHARSAGRIVLMDFGSTRESSSALAEDTYGTPLYTAPEVLAGGKPTAAADLYALGVVLYRLACGHHPVEAASLEELRSVVARGALVPLRARRPDLPPAFIAVVERALAADPAVRFADAASMERALHRVLGVEASPRRARPRLRRAAALAAVVVAAVALATAAWGPRWARPWLERAEAGNLPSVRVVAERFGSETGGVFGITIVPLGDWNGDGVPDFAVGAPGEGDDRGRVHLFGGGADTSRAALAILEGISPGDRFGASIAARGDFDGDGSADLVVGAPESDRAGEDAGSVIVFWGGAGSATRAPLVIEGPRPGQRFGHAVAITRDLDGDGADDLLVAAPTDDQGGLDAGRAYLFRGGPGMDGTPDLEFGLGLAGSHFGSGGVRGIGDFDADGHGDFAIGTTYAPDPAPRAGRALVYFGGPGLDATPDLVLRGTGTDDFFGDVCPAGDVNGDGHPDLVIGALRAEGQAHESGTATIFFGGPRPDARADLVLRGKSSSALFGRWSDASTDFDRDGFADVLVGAPGEGAGTDSAGAVYLYRGGRTMDDVPDLVVRGIGTRTGFGTSPVALGDVRGDGIPDFAAGAPIDSRPVKASGSIRVFDCARFHLVRPRPGAVRVGDPSIAVEWLGTTRADVAWSVDDGRTWTTALARVGGAADNSAQIDLPAVARGASSLRVRVTPSDHRVAGRGAEAIVR